MDDLISRQAVIDALAEWGDVAIENRLKNIPSAQPKKVCIAEIKIDGDELQECVNRAMERVAQQQKQRKKGRWIYGEHDIAMCDGYRCDKCGFFVPWDYKFTFIDFINDYHFCPNCGSDMRGEDDEAD